MKLIPEPDFPELQRDPKSLIWYVRKFVVGKGELFKSTRERKSKAKAKTIALKLLTDFMGAPQKGHTALFKDIAEEVIKLKASKSEATQFSATHHLRNRVIPYLGGYRVDQVNESTVEDFFNEMRLKNPKGKLFNDWKHIVMVMKRAFEKGLIKRPLKVPNPDPKTEPKYVFSFEEEEKLLKEANPRLGLQMLMGFRMGMRPGEILSLQKDRIDIESDLIRLKAEDTKTRESRDVPIHPDVLVPLMAQMEASKGAYLFGHPKTPDKEPFRSSNRKAFERLKAKVGVKRGTLHDLRRTCATRMGRSSLPPAMACKILGMQLDIYLSIYCKPTSDDIRDSFNEHFATPERKVAIRGNSGKSKNE